MILSFKYLQPTPYKKNCWLWLTYENLRGFSWLAFYLLNLLLKPRNFPYTNTLAVIKKKKKWKN